MHAACKNLVLTFVSLSALLLLGIICYGQSFNKKTNKGLSQVSFWLTTGDGSVSFAKQNTNLIFTRKTNKNPVIDVNENKTYQEIDGFGYTLTGGSAMWINRMNESARAALLKELFTTDGNNIGVSYLRVSIGASDLDDHVFSYNDLPTGQTDTGLTKFSLAPDRKDLIPVLKQILAINPKIKILGSPWSAPTWMKSNNDTRGGSLKPEYFDAYANYFVKYIREMGNEGIRIDAVTIQNEPLHPGNNPSMYMTAQEQSSFIKQSLGPAFKTAGINAKIIVYDHNADRPDYPLTIYNDPDASKYVDGAAFHLYAGKIEALMEVHNAYPDKNIYFTEQWIGAPGKLKEDLLWHVKTLIIGATRNWCRTVLEWNLASDPFYKPHTDRGGCDRCLGALTIDGNKVKRNPAYYIIAHASKFVRPGSFRIDTNVPETLNNVAFKAPDGNTILIVQNDSKSAQSFNIRYKGKLAASTLPSEAVGTYIW